MSREAVCVMPGFRVAGREKGEHRQQTRGGRGVCVRVCVCCVLEGLDRKRGTAES